MPTSWVLESEASAVVIEAASCCFHTWLAEYVAGALCGEEMSQGHLCALASQAWPHIARSGCARLTNLLGLGGP